MAAPSHSYGSPQSFLWQAPLIPMGGWERTMAAEAFFACGKNEELAANFLFDNAGQD